MNTYKHSKQILPLEKRINFNVPIGVFQALKIVTVQNNMSIKMFVLRLILEELHQMGAIEIKN